jgi:hypothetical protein
VRQRNTTTERTARSRDADRARLEGAAEFYLRACYGTRTAARADEFAEFLRLAELAGMPLRDFLRKRQLAYAQRLLHTTQLTVAQIALASAFGTEWTFHRCFKAAFGLTPSVYREQVTKCE